MEADKEESNWEQRARANWLLKESVKVNIGSLLGVRISTNPEKYLGLPTMIGRHTNCWNIALLQSLFPPALVSRICCIPLAKSKSADVLDASCIYSPKSGYKLLMQEHTHISVSDTEVQHSIFHSFYGKLWGLNPPTKCKIFFWRLLNNFLPTFVNLQYKRVQVRNTCPLCESVAESTDHLLFLCPFTKQVLSSVGLPHPLHIIAHYIKMSLLAFILEIESLVEVSALKPVPKKAKWFPPDSNSIKLNFDASFNNSTNSSVTGIVARNSQGLVMAACTFPHSAVADAFTAEALACNMVAHELAKLGIQFSEPMYWMEEVPMQVERLVLRDLPP
ncbi:hypothetical protein V6N13_091221 [Hibiscus sabdariffa]